MAKRLTGADIVVRNDAELMTTMVDDELIGMSVEQGSCYGLNGVGTRIWALLAEPRSVDSLCAELAEEYDVGPAECRRDVLAYLEAMRSEGLVAEPTR
ncbi:MAG TPA: PqqD family peptide modification chaperone [Croceibacterium sp.]|nr:PqqD family peptide modification chaperone [Croceibacterium sp.]